MSDVNFLILSNMYDFSTDLICYELERRGQKYLRLNRDRFSEYKLLYALGDDLAVFRFRPAYRGDIVYFLSISYKIWYTNSY